MPAAETILDGLTNIANAWQGLAVAWHVLFAALALAAVAGWRPSARLMAFLLDLPLVSVSALAWAASNAFNGATFATLSLSLAWIAVHLPKHPIRCSSSLEFMAGSALVGFGVVYPHFLHADRWITYAYASPLGLLPCPTLSTVIGVTLMFRLLGTKVWSIALAAAGLIYGAIGVFGLGVRLDVGLLLGALALAATVTFAPSPRASAPANV
jgi:hypothetical protein